jgi:uncharacterized membrane protein
MELRRRTLVKTLSYRVIGVIVTGAVAWFFTRKLSAAVEISTGDLTLKLLIYYAHERAWVRIPFGKLKPPEYNI